MIGAVVLAAGRGRRFGYTPKLLASFHGTALIGHALHALEAAPVAPLVLVTGRRHAAVAAIGRRCIRPAGRLHIVRNRRYREGMAGSLRLGIRALPARCDAALICLADMPLIDTRTIRRLCAGWHRGLDYLRPVNAGRPGHPVLVSSALFDAISALRGDQGAQTVLARVPAARKRLLNGNAGTIADIDTPGRLRRVQRMT